MSEQNAINADDLKAMPQSQRQELFVSLISEFDDMEPCLSKIFQEINYETKYKKDIDRKTELNLLKITEKKNAKDEKNNAELKAQQVTSQPGKSQKTSPTKNVREEAKKNKAAKTDVEQRDINRKFKQYYTTKAKNAQKFYCDEKGDITREENTYGTVFQDYNYGDVCMVFDNKLRVFQEKSILKAITDTQNIADPKSFKKLIKSGQTFEAFRQSEIRTQLQHYKKSYFKDLVYIDKKKESQKNAKFVNAFDVYEKFKMNINVKNNMLPTKSYLSDERTAFLNALLYYSTWCYTHDLENIKSEKMPFDSQWKTPLKEMFGFVKVIYDQYEGTFGNLIDEEDLDKLKDHQAKLVATINENFEIEDNKLYIKCEKELKEDHGSDEYGYENCDKECWEDILDKLKELDWAKTKTRNNNSLNRQPGIAMKKKEAFPMFLIDTRLVDYLYKKMIMIRLKKLNIYCREFYIAGLTKSCVVIKADKALLNKLSTEKGTLKEKEQGNIDLLSLEPLDSQKRPFRTRNKKYKQYVEYQTEQKRVEGNQGEAEPLDSDQKGLTSISSTNIEILKQLLRELDNMHPADLYLQVKLQKTATDNLLKEAELQCRYSAPTFEFEIKTQKTLDRADMYAPFLFNSYILFMYMNLREHKKDPNVKKYFPFIWRLIFQKAQSESNMAISRWRICCPKKIKTVWSHIGTDPMPPYEPYVNSNSTVQKWRTYEINEMGHRDAFPRMQRIRLLNQAINAAFKVSDLIDENIIETFDPLHDNWLLNGDEQQELFEDIIPMQFQYSVSDLKLQEVFSQLKESVNDPRDFKKYSIKDSFGLGDDVQSDTVDEDLRIVWLYFGERITLYTKFNHYFTDWLFKFGIFGAILCIPIYIFYTARMVTEWKILMAIFSLCVVFFTSFFVEYWRSNQSRFALEYGQLNYEETQAERPSYIGEYHRDFGSNLPNKKIHDGTKRAGYQCLSWTVSIIIIIMSVACSILLLMLKKILYDKGVHPDLAAVIPSVINTLVIQIFSYFYENHIVINMTLRENYRTRTELEDSLIYKLFAFNFLNFANSLIIIGVLKEEQEAMFGACIPPSGNQPFYNDYRANAAGVFDPQYRADYSSLACFGEQEIQIFINLAIGLITTSVVPLITGWYDEWSKNNKLCNKINLERVYDWGKVDAIIEDELKNSSFEKTYEIDQIILEYSALFKNLSLLFMFGIVVPVGWIIACISTYVARKSFFSRLILFTKRPAPRGAQDIGSWEKILQIINILAIFFSAALNGYNTKVLEWNSWPVNRENKKIFSFYIFAFAGLAIRVLAYLLVADVSPTFSNIFRRQNNRTAIVKKDNFLAQTQRCGMQMIVPDIIDVQSARNKQESKNKRAKKQQEAGGSKNKEGLTSDRKALSIVQEGNEEDSQENENIMSSPIKTLKQMSKNGTPQKYTERENLLEEQTRK